MKASSKRSTRKAEVRDLMSEPVFTLQPGDDLEALYDLMDAHHVRHVPVVDRDGDIVGLVTQRDLARSALGAQDALPLSTQQEILRRRRVLEIMATEVETVEPDQDLRTSIANCASVFLRGGKAPNFERFRRAGVRVGIGTDAERMDFFAQLRATGFASKQAYGAGDAAMAADLLRAATMGAADILRRPDLGRIEKGATADLLVIDALKPHLQPINDPVRSLVWYATPSDIDTVLINGRPVIRGGKAVGIDEAAVIAEGAAATRRVWAESRVRGYFPLEADPRKP